MKNKIFDKHLFFEIFKQISPLALFFMIISYIFEIIISIDVAYSTLGNDLLNNCGYYFLSIVFFSLIVVPILVIKAFSFCNSKVKGDFYYSISESKTSLFCSAFSAVMAWDVIAIVFETIIQVIILTGFMGSKIYSVPMLLFGMFSYLTVGLYMAGAFSVGMSLSGSVFYNVLLGLMSGFSFRGVLQLSKILITKLVPFISFDNTDFLSSDKNIIFAYIGKAINNTTPDIFTVPALKVFYTSPENVIYTLGVAIVFMIIALLIFNKRPAEASGVKVYSKMVINIVAIWISSAFPLILGLMLYNDSYVKDCARPDNVKFVLMLLLLTVLTYVLIQFVLTKDKKAVVKSLKLISFTVLIDALFVGSILIYVHNENKFLPTENSIDYVTLSGDIRPDDEMEYSSISYLSDKSKDIKITDKSIINILISFYGKKPILDYAYGEDYCAFKVSFNGRKSRIVYITGDDIDNIINLLSKNKEFRTACTTLPKLEDVHFSEEDSTTMDCNMIYKRVNDNVKTVDFNAWIKRNYFDTHCFKDDDAYTDCFNNISFTTYEGLNYYQFQILVNDNFGITS